MKQLYLRYRNTSLRSRLMIPLTAALLTSLLICQWLLFAFTEDTLNRQLQKNAAISAETIRSYADERIRSVIELMYSIRLADSIESNLTLLLQGEDTSAITASRIARDFSVYKATEPLIASLCLYTPKGLMTGVGIPVDKDFSFEDSVFQQLLDATSDSVIVCPAHADPIFISHRQVVPILHRFQVEGYSGECVIIANVDLYLMWDLLREKIPDDGSQILLLDQTGSLLTPADTGAQASFLAQREQLTPIMAEHPFFTQELAGESFQLGSVATESAPWTLVYLQAKQQIFSILDRIRVFCLVVTLLVTILALMSSSWMLRTILHPLTRLCEHIRSTPADAYQDAFDYPYEDEFGTLIQAYNRMIRHIRLLIQEQQGYIRQLEAEKARADIEQEKKRRAELTALQAQINPHFLYNALDSIHWKAEKAGADDISQMTMALANLFRISLSRGAEIIPVSQEIRHVESYLQIQKHRYRDRLSYTLDIEPDVLQLHTVKLVLQPLVENAIYHGIKESEHSGQVHIQCRREGDTLVMQVMDNGQGIPEPRLQKLQADLSRGHSEDRDGYGIFNVNERIRLHFGEGYGLSLDSQWGSGTISTVRLPAISHINAQ